MFLSNLLVDWLFRLVLCRLVVDFHRLLQLLLGFFLLAFQIVDEYISLGDIQLEYYSILLILAVFLWLLIMGFYLLGLSIFNYSC